MTMQKVFLTVILVISSLLLGCRTNITDKSGLVRAYYVNSRTGDDRAPGTISKPVKTIGEINKRITEAPGSIYFAGGQVFEGNLVLNNIKAPESVPLKICSYGEGKAQINGGDMEAVRIIKCGNIYIQDLDLNGNGRKNGSTTNGLSLSGSDNCVIENIFAEGFQKSGIDLYNCRDTKILKTLAAGNGFSGINVMGSSQDSSKGILIRDCKAENNAGDPTNLNNHSGNGILIGVSDSVVIDHCTATNNGWDMPRQGNGPVGIWAWMSDHVTIQYCISYRNRTSKGGKDGGGFDLDGGMTNSLIQYCLSYENEGAGYGLFQYPGAADWSDNVIRYCISINDATTTEGSGSFFIWNGSDSRKQLSNCYIYNNVAYNTVSPVVSFENASDHENFIFENNIFICKGQVISGRNNGSRFMGNVWWSSEGKINFGKFGYLKDWAKESGQETENGKILGCQADPHLPGPFLTEITDPYKLNDLRGYILKTDSPLKDKGLKIKSLFGFDPPQIDFFGNPVPQGSAPEPGIYEMRQNQYQ